MKYGGALYRPVWQRIWIFSRLRLVQNRRDPDLRTQSRGDRFIVQSVSQIFETVPYTNSHILIFSWVWCRVHVDEANSSQ